MNKEEVFKLFEDNLEYAEALKTFSRETHYFSFSFKDCEEDVKVRIFVSDTEYRDLSLCNKLDLAVLNELYEKLNISGFGQGRKYLKDNSVRKSREGRNIMIVGETLDNILPQYYTDRYQIEFYKIVLYKKGDFFTWHADTKRAHLERTVVITLDSDFVGGELQVKKGGKVDEDDDSNCITLGERLTISVFNPNVPHRVRPVEEGIRVSILINLFDLNRPCKRNMLSIQRIPIELPEKSALESFDWSLLTKNDIFNVFMGYPEYDHLKNTLKDEFGIESCKVALIGNKNLAIEFEAFVNEMSNYHQDQEKYEYYEERLDNLNDLTFDDEAVKFPVSKVLISELRGSKELRRAYHYCGNSPGSIEGESDYEVGYEYGLLINPRSLRDETKRVRLS